MINPEELRIGNKLERQYEDGSIADGYYEYFVDLSTFSRLENVPEFADWLKGISITEELLVKLGYKKADSGDWCKEFTDIRFNADLLCYIDAGLGVVPVDHIKFFHQLQNLIHSLTGAELVLK